MVYEEKPDGRQLFYLYDSYGYLTAIRYYNGDTSTLVGYYVTTNAQGDVIGIYNAEGALRATYEYDAWGNIIAIKNGNGDTVTSDTHIAKLNSIRYRSYCYDNETGLYYVISRYYNPQVGRFLNADNQLSTGDVLGMNMFAYCGNNPVSRVDPTGEAWGHWLLAAGIVAGCAVATVISAGSFAFAMTAFGFATMGVSVGGTTGVLAMATIGSAIALGTSATVAAFNSSSADDFADQGSLTTVVATALGGFSGGYAGHTNSKVQTSNISTNTNTSRGSTGRTEPANLNEQLAMKQVQSNPYAGTPLKKVNLHDPRWPASDGWQKMQQIVYTSQGDINIHYVYNQTLKMFDDFKFTS